MLKDDSDYDSYFEDTMKAGHYENDRESVSIMIRSSQDVIHDLIGFGVDFARDGKRKGKDSVASDGICPCRPALF